jgi:aspartyl/glutamyl-tRNA(Asn/Gln) amidotransferase C subunit
VCVLTDHDCDLVSKLSDLAKILLSEKEKEEICKRVSSTRKLFSELDEIDTENLKPLYHVLEVSGKTREDEPLGFDYENVRRSLKGRFKDEYIEAPWKGGYE